VVAEAQAATFPSKAAMRRKRATALSPLSGHFICTEQCLLLGVSRTWRLHCEMSAYDPADIINRQYHHRFLS